VRRFAGLLVALGILGLAATAILWWLPADDFVLAPDRAKPLAGRVAVADSRPAGRGDVYYVDVFVRRLRMLEKLLPFTRPDGSTTLPESALLPPGTTEQQRDRQNVVDMQRSEEIAAVVALRALGYKVEATPRGVLVVDVYADAPAAGKLRPDDVIVGVDGVAVRTPAELRRLIGKRKPGDPVRLTVRRDGRTIVLEVGTIPNPEDRTRPIVGINVDQNVKIERLPVKVDIDLGDVGGPSAGLPFALEIARKLGRDVTHGCRVAATGELTLEGTVVPIGGVKQKTFGARKAGVDIFVVPAGQNAADARRYAGGLRILPVKTFQQAFRKLTTSRLKC
jgi:PDZ domain-containing protein